MEWGWLFVGFWLAGRLSCSVKPHDAKSHRTCRSTVRVSPTSRCLAECEVFMHTIWDTITPAV